MTSPLHRRSPALRGGLDLGRFEPIGPHAHVRIEELIKRGARIVRVRSDAVVLRRAAQMAIVDQLGRVSWSG